jgi:DNA-binding SARP family transcriptional activator/Tol biopolymer transport system component/tRNA A-37 threonylcarbamoyl transferase component Bud32
MEFLILGSLEVTDDGRKLALGGPKQRAVLAHLILRANHVIPADLLIDGLWGEEPPESARNTLQTYVYRLRKLLGNGRLEGRDGGYVLAAAPGEIDAARFEALVKQGKAQVASDPAAAAATLNDALSLWRADALADVTEEPSLRGEAARLEELRLSATEYRVSAEIAMGGHSAVVPELESLTARYPLRERMWANLMLALYRSGRQAEALSTFERARQVLVEELGADPSHGLQRLHEQILHRDPALGAPAREAPEPAWPRVRPSRVDLQPGTEVAGYRIVSTLGRGGMSVVYLAEHDWLQRKVALKVLAPQLAEDERFRERFVRESRLAASLDHPNVIPIYEAGASGGELFIAMRYVEGTDLRSLLHEGGALEPARALAIVRQVAAALDAAHEQGLVHRDVKPGNVLLARQRGSEVGEHVYLSDFGLTKRSASDSGITGTGQFVGTLDYAAPEQFKGRTPDDRTDVYSLGCVLFECLTGSPPFTSENDAGLMYAHLQAVPPSVTAQQPELPREIDRVVAMAMAKAPADRQQTAGALANEAAQALGVGGDASTGMTPEQRAFRRILPAIAVAVALVAGIVLATVFRNEPQHVAGEPPASSPAIANPTPNPAFRTVHRPLEPEEERLLSSIPEGESSDCAPLDRPEPVQGELAALVCDAGDVEVLYELFPTQSDMNNAIQGSVNSHQAPKGQCATETLAVTPYTIGGSRAGRVLCYTLNRDEVDQSHIEWTYEDSSIYAHAVRNDLADLSLYDWWLSTSGPVASNGDATGTTKDPPASLGPRLRDGSYLLSLTPRQVSHFFPDLFTTPGRGGTLAIHLGDGTYELAADGTVVQSGRTLLTKPDAIVFVPEQALVCGTPLLPVTYEWTATAQTVTWAKMEGNDCAGPQPFSGLPWTRAPSGLIAFESGSDIALMDAGGFVIKKLTTGTTTRPNISPVWSPGGSRIAFAGASEEGFDLYVMNADGSDITRLTDLPGDEAQPAWSPDGNRIAFVFDDLGDPHFRTGIAVANADGTGLTELVTRDDQNLWGPTWSPDGNRIAFHSEAREDLFVIGADGADGTAVQPDRGTVLVTAGWTPDGRRLLFLGELEGKERLQSMRPDGSDVRVVLEDLPVDAPVLFDWSPDRRWILVSRPWLSGETDMYLVGADGDGVFYLGGGTEPRWRPRAT